MRSRNEKSSEVIMAEQIARQVMQRMQSKLLPQTSMWLSRREAAKMLGVSDRQFRANMETFKNLGFPDAAPHNGKWLRAQVEKLMLKLGGIDAVEATPASSLLSDIENIDVKDMH